MTSTRFSAFFGGGLRYCVNSNPNRTGRIIEAVTCGEIPAFLKAAFQKQKEQKVYDEQPSALF
jgi:hypothetical protein